MKQLLIGSIIGIVGVLVISLFSSVGLKTLGGLLILIAIGMGMLGIADIIYHRRHGDMSTDPFSNKRQQRK
jgi:phosphoglycerol transferase MdoB-like AlkP superfamily enzyme